MGHSIEANQASHLRDQLRPTRLWSTSLPGRDRVFGCRNDLQRLHARLYQPREEDGRASKREHVPKSLRKRARCLGRTLKSSIRKETRLLRVAKVEEIR